MQAGHVRAPWVGLALLVASSVGLMGEARTRQVAITSETDWEGFGQRLAAEGDLIIARDLSQNDRGLGFRILRLAGGRAVEEAQFEPDYYDHVLSIGVSAGRVVAQHGSTLAFYEAEATRWTRVQTLPLEGPCLDAFPDAKLAQDVLLVGAIKALCVYERRDGKWVAAAELPVPRFVDEPSTNGDRIAQPDDDPRILRLWRRVGGDWRIEREIDVGPGRKLVSFAMSKRWLAITTVGYSGDRRIEIYSLGDTLEPVATLRPQVPDDLFGWQLAVSDRDLIASGETHQAFRFASGSWRTNGELPKSEATVETVVIGDLGWIGRTGNEPGVIEGYSLE